MRASGKDLLTAGSERAREEPLIDPEPLFDIAAAAGWYSAVAGLLAGFALLAILLPLDHEAKHGDTEYAANSVVIYICSFFSLLILSISYAVMAGRTSAAVGVAAHEQMLNGAAFGLATLLLLLGLRAILRTYGANREVFAPANALIMTVTSVLAPLIVIALQFSNTFDLQRYRVGAETDSVPAGVWLNLAMVVLGAAAVLLVTVFRTQLPVKRAAPIVIAKVVLGYTVAATLWIAVVAPLIPVEVLTSAALEHALMGATVVGAVSLSAGSWIGR